MTRIELGGEGFPIPKIALPDTLVTDDVIAPITLVLEDGQDFEKANYVGLGYTHFEVWAIGAAGGVGGGEETYVRWDVAITTEVMPETEFNAYKAEELRRDSFTYPPGYHFSFNDPVTGEMLSLTVEEMFDYRHPGRQFRVYTYSNPRFLKGPNGGGGGGGGLHKVVGFLDDLDDVVPVIVGEVGANALPGQGVVNGLWDPSPFSYPNYPAPYTGSYGPEQHIYGWFATRYPHVASIPPPQPGDDGGASSFGDVAQASGGKGGAGSIEWIDGVKFFGSYGGAGGSGGSLVAGGGGAGSMSSDKAGRDGGWDGIIGKGGGGGRGGRVYSSQYRPGQLYYPNWMAVPNDGALMHSAPAAGGSPVSYPSIIVPATNGGQGSFSYGDTSVYGQRQFKSNQLRYFRSYDYSEGVQGELVEERAIPTDIPIFPGGGGGAKAPGKRYFGSKAAGFSPNGAVIIKIFKI